MGVVLIDSENSDRTGGQTMRRKLIIWTQRHRRPLTVMLYVLLLSVLTVLAFVPSYLDVILAPLFGVSRGSMVAYDSDYVGQPVDVADSRPSPSAVVRKVFDLPFVPQRDFLCDEMHLKVSINTPTGLTDQLLLLNNYIAPTFRIKCLFCRHFNGLT